MLFLCSLPWLLCFVTATDKELKVIHFFIRLAVIQLNKHVLKYNMSQRGGTDRDSMLLDL